MESRIVSFLSIGEGWHNYHHAFPWDYRAAELGSRYSVTTFIINILAVLGLAYDLKVAPYTMIEHRARKRGDGTHHLFGEDGLAQPIPKEKEEQREKEDGKQVKVIDDNDNLIEEVGHRKRPVTTKG